MNGFFDAGQHRLRGRARRHRDDRELAAAGVRDDYWHGDRGHVQVIISDEHPSFFGRIFGQSIGHGYDRCGRGAATGKYEFALARCPEAEGCSTARVRGNSTITIFPAPGYTGHGGYVQVNSVAAGSSDDACTTSGSGALNINGAASLTAPKANVHGGCNGRQDSRAAGP